MSLDPHAGQALRLDYFLMSVLQSFGHVVCLDDVAIL